MSDDQNSPTSYHGGDRPVSDQSSQPSPMLLTPEGLVASGWCRWFLTCGYQLGVLCLPIMGLIERAAWSHPQDWPAFLSEIMPLMDARRELDDEIRQLERKYVSRRKRFFPAVERLVLGRAQELEKSGSYREKISDLLASKPVPRHMRSALDELVQLGQAWLPHFANPEAKPANETEQERTRRAIKKLLQHPPGRRRMAIFAEGYKLQQEGEMLHLICMRLDSRYRQFKTASERNAARKRMAEGIARYAKKQGAQSK
ncbi:MAG TPA: hypothetical protein VEI55_05680 [Candidatus Acidoferrum sp.]|nr:hypothetical protein [Candidatus Acidoferrum sp.]